MLPLSSDNAAHGALEWDFELMSSCKRHWECFWKQGIIKLVVNTACVLEGILTAIIRSFVRTAVV